MKDMTHDIDTISRNAAILSPHIQYKNIFVAGVSGGGYLIEKLVRQGLRKITICDPSMVKYDTLSRVNFTSEDVRWRGEIAQVPYFELVKPPTPEPMGRHLEVSEVATLLRSTSHQHIKMFLLMLAGTAARPQAVLELKYEQIDFERNIIDLNPIGRTQTQKTRAVVKLPQFLKPLLLVQRDLGLSDYIVQFNGEKVKSTKTAWGKLRNEARLDTKVLPYSIRRTMARFLRMQGVPAWEVAEQLGHRSTGYKITELYTAHSPDYLEKSVTAIDVFFEQVACELRVNDLREIFRE